LSVFIYIKIILIIYFTFIYLFIKYLSRSDVNYVFANTRLPCVKLRKRNTIIAGLADRQMINETASCLRLFSISSRRPKQDADPQCKCPINHVSCQILNENTELRLAIILNFDLFTVIIVYHSQLRSGKLKLARLIDEDTFQRKFNECIIQCRDYYPQCFIIANYVKHFSIFLLAPCILFSFLCITRLLTIS